MTDLHCHILPGVDDGAANLDVALTLVDMMARQGVRRIALTSHFRSDKMTPEQFLESRSAAWEELKGALKPTADEIQFKLGSEVFFAPGIGQLDLQRLCLEGTDLLLLELPTNYYPQFLDHTLLDLQARGIVPLIAHVERYAYVMEDPSLLAQWIRNGAYIQVNAGALRPERSQRKQVLKLMKWGLVHVIASDTHSPDKRPPNLQMAMQTIRDSLGQETVDRLLRNAQTLFQGELPPDAPIHEPRRILGRWM